MILGAFKNTKKKPSNALPDSIVRCLFLVVNLLSDASVMRLCDVCELL